MAGYKGHITGAIVANTVYIGLLEVASNRDLLDLSRNILNDWQFLAGLFVIAILFALWPDVDTNSAGQNLFFGIAFVADIILIASGHLAAAAFLGLIAMTPIIGKHRGWTHSYLAMVLVPLPIILGPYLYNQQIWSTGLLLYGAAVVGYFSHLLLDGKVIKSFAIRSHRH